MERDVIDMAERLMVAAAVKNGVHGDATEVIRQQAVAAFVAAEIFIQIRNGYVSRRSQP
jgi:hypothetical protein